MLGPNAKRLFAHKMAHDAIPKSGGFADGIKFLSTKESIVSGARKAAEWTTQAIDAVRDAAEPNPWKDADDEEIAREILRRIDAKKAHRCFNSPEMENQQLTGKITK
jgi:hypothetical protein